MQRTIFNRCHKDDNVVIESARERGNLERLHGSQALIIERLVEKQLCCTLA